MVPREQTGVPARPLRILFERLWGWGEVHEEWRRGSVTPSFKTDKKEGLGNCSQVNLSTVPELVMEQLILEIIPGCMKDRQATVSSQHRFTKRGHA